MMEWFKHKTNAHDDPVVSDAWDEFGDAGYLIWFVLLELYGQNFKIKEPERKLHVSKTFMRRKFRKSWTKVEQVLRFYSTMGKLSLEVDTKMVTVGIPKFDVILSNWTRREVSKPTEAPTEAPTAKSKNKNKKKIKSKITPYIPPGGIDLKSNGDSWINIESWNDFIEHRKNIKKPLTEKSVKIALNFLRKNQQTQKEIIENTIMNRWTGLFSVNRPGPDKSNDQITQGSKMAYERYQKFKEQL